MSAPTLTAQEVFDIAVGGVLKQGRRCVDATGRCVYRGPNGMKCAAGFVFTDEEVDGVEGVTDEGDPLSDDYSAETVIVHRAPRLAGHLSLLVDLQMVHDMEDTDRWASRYRAIGKKYGLSTAVIDQWEASQ